MEKRQEVSSNPIHVKDEKGNLSPTALIPFCEFGGNMSTMGVKFDQYDFPFCYAFKAKILEGQLCYVVDPNKYKRYLRNKDKIGLELYISLNEERKLSLKELNELNFNYSIDQSIEDNELVSLGTIGNI